MTDEKISIITISFNSEKTIGKTIQSVLAQSYRPLEYIFVDGGSTDKTVEIIESFIPELSRQGIEVSLKSEPDKGISDAFNKGIERARGNIIGIINSDDQLMDNALELVAAAFGSEIEVVCGDCLWIDEENHLQYVRRSKMKLKKLKYEMVLMHPTCFVRKTTYDKNGLFDTSFKYAMDKELMARFYRNGVHFKYIPETIVMMSAGGASDSNIVKVREEGIRIAKENGVPEIFVTVRNALKDIELMLISRVKRYATVWFIIKGKTK